MKIYQLSVFMLFALTFGGCNSVQSNNTAVVNQPTNKATNKNQPSSQAAFGSPTETLKTFAEATKKKDAATIRKILSKSTMKVIEESAKEQNISVDEMLTKAEDPEGKDLPETRNEKIVGDTATLEVKDDITGEFDVMPFVKEDGSWKIALDIFMESMMEKIKGDMKKPAPPSPTSKGNTKSKTAP
jgi:hypothetical protein